MLSETIKCIQEQKGAAKCSLKLPKPKNKVDVSIKVARQISLQIRINKWFRGPENLKKRKNRQFVFKLF